MALLYKMYSMLYESRNRCTLYKTAPSFFQLYKSILNGHLIYHLAWFFVSYVQLRGCCYITVVYATAASQNEFCSYKLSLNKKPIFFRTLQNTFPFNDIYLLSNISRKIRSVYGTFLELCKHRFVMDRCPIHRYVAALLVHMFHDRVTISQRILQMH